MERNTANLRKYRAVIAKIWEERPHECVKCGKYLHEAKWHNFDHIKGRRTEQLCLDPNNIQILCYACHHAKTFKTTPKNAEWLDF